MNFFKRLIDEAQQRRRVQALIEHDIKMWKLDQKMKATTKELDHFNQPGHESGYEDTDGTYMPVWWDN